MIKPLILVTCALTVVLTMSNGPTPVCAASACGDMGLDDNNSPGDLPEIQKGIDWMAKGNCNAPSTRGNCWNATGTVQYGCFGPSSRLQRWGESANDLLASAVDAIVNGDKYLAIGRIELAFCHDPHFRDMVSRDKKLVYEYVRNNYVAGWDDVTGLGLHSQAFKVGTVYSDNPPMPELGLKDCVGIDTMSRVAVPEGLQITICDHGSGSPYLERGCQTFGPGLHDLRNAHPRFDDLTSYVKATRQTAH